MEKSLNNQSPDLHLTCDLLKLINFSRIVKKKNCDPTPLKDRKKNKTNSLINKMIDILAKNGKKMTNLLKE
ncbi:hypothetical protein BpHYR1_016821 [Brachionus plicatilis]|uniref:Uncharacterized protein n=1 Tax=Brachionus plicatilis TaxID=10195 RepID=A0A3M7QC39_BRAPC|nr:hypothetical protein BpHYR1_016821 [Brachionus plicatilis]